MPEEEGSVLTRRLAFAAVCLLAAGCTGGEPSKDPAAFREYALPAHVVVQPLFFVPADQAAPAGADLGDLAAHVEWSRTRYAELLGGRTFDVSASIDVVAGAQTLAEYHTLPEGGVPAITAELLEHYGHSRWNNPFVFLAIVTDPVYSAGARPVNGGYDGGGSIGVISSNAFAAPNFQSTLQHELGHAFGLPHVDVYGHDMATSPSIMSYNEDHWTDGFEDSATPGVLVPEDLRALSFAARAFGPPPFRSPAATPPHGPIAPVVCLGPMDLPGLPPDVISVTTPSGELYETSASNAVQGTRIAPSAGPGITFDASTMWHSGAADADGFVELRLEFPVDVTLDAIAVHSQHSGLYHAATGVIVEAEIDGVWEEAGVAEGIGVDAHVAFPEATATSWRIRLRAGESGMVTLRGLRFFVDGAEVFPPCVPYRG